MTGYVVACLLTWSLTLVFLLHCSGIPWNQGGHYRGMLQIWCCEIDCNSSSRRGQNDSCCWQGFIVVLLCLLIVSLWSTLRSFAKLLIRVQTQYGCCDGLCSIFARISLFCCSAFFVVFDCAFRDPPDVMLHSILVFCVFVASFVCLVCCFAVDFAGLCRICHTRQCTSAKGGLEGRKFADKTVLTSYYPEDSYASRIFTWIFDALCLFEFCVSAFSYAFFYFSCIAYSSLSDALSGHHGLECFLILGSNMADIMANSAQLPPTHSLLYDVYPLLLMIKDLLFCLLCEACRRNQAMSTSISDWMSLSATP